MPRRVTSLPVLPRTILGTSSAASRLDGAVVAATAPVAAVTLRNCLRLPPPPPQG